MTARPPGGGGQQAQVGKILFSKSMRGGESDLRGEDDGNGRKDTKGI